ncbi:TRAP transporter small permease [Demequina aurantiaca]|uniref:TRAP transporter small permease n=1 Tax=Demequina aurantiaca TaxID=676200 RepID=UPI003D3369D6
MNRYRRGVGGVLRWAVVALFALLVLTVLWQVFTRQVVQSPAAWTDELARYAFVWLSFFGAALVFSEKGHIAVELLRNKLHGLPRRSIEVFVNAVILVFSTWLLVIGGYLTSVGAWGQNATALPFQLGQLYLAMPIAGLLISSFALQDMVLAARGRRWDPVAGSTVPLEQPQVLPPLAKQAEAIEKDGNDG